MSVSCSICNRQLKNKHSMSNHICKFHPMRESDGDLTMKDLKEELLSDTGIMEPPKCQADTINEDRLGDETNIADCNKNEMQIEDKTHNNTYSSTCPSRMKDLVANVDRLYIPKRRSKKGKHRTEPFPRQRNAKTITSFSENASLLTSGSLKSDLKNITSKSSQSLCLLTSYGIRNLLFKKIDDDVVPGNLTEKQQLLVKAALSLTSLN